MSCRSTASSTRWARSSTTCDAPCCCGLEPDWSLIGIATLGTLLYLAVGYRLFKRLEVNFADIA